MRNKVKVVCKKNYPISLVKGDEYFYGIAKDSNNNDRYLIDDGQYLLCDFSKKDFIEYFYTEQETRKEKINKLNNLVV